MSVEDEVHRAIQAAGGTVAGPDRYAMSADGGPRVFVEIERAKKGRFAGLNFVVPIVAQPGATDGASVDWLPTVELVVEEDAHRQAKTRGVSRELQTGDAVFDARVYIESAVRDGELAPLLANAAFRRAVLVLFDQQLRSIRLHNGRRPRLVVWPGAGAMRDSAAIGRVVSSVGALARALPDFRSTGFRMRPGPSGLITYATAVLALPGLLAAAISSDAWETVTHTLALHAVLASVPIYVLVVLVARWRARKSSTGPRRLLTVVATGLITVPSLTVTVAYAANSNLDDSVRIRKVWLEEKYANRSGRSTFLGARLAPWPPLTEPVVIGVEEQTYNRLPPSGEVDARIGDGFLGYPWVAALEPSSR